MTPLHVIVFDLNETLVDLSALDPAFASGQPFIVQASPSARIKTPDQSSREKARARH